MGRAPLSLDDFEWVEHGFDRWFLFHKKKDYWIADIQNYNGWLLRVRHNTDVRDRPHLDTLDAAKALAGILATQQMEQYQDELYVYKHIPNRLKKDGPPPFREGIFKVG